MSDIRSLPPRFRSEHSESSRILSAYSRMIAFKKQQPACRERLRHLRLVKASSLSVIKSAVYGSYDAMSRITSEANVLGTFGYNYVELANHVSCRDVTGGYIVVDVARLRTYMSKISDPFVALLGANESDLIEPQDSEAQ